jgi:KAP family P-loop domain
MKLFPPLVQIDENEGFTPAKDIFGRKKIADGLTHLVSQVEDPIVLAVDGQWGSGKTIFLKMWRGELQQLGFPVIYFDAFANDYFEDAFVPLAAEIIGLAQTKLKANASTFEDLKTKTTKVAKVVLRSALRIGVKAATLGALDAGDIEGAIADEVETAFDKQVGELITKQDVVKSDMVAFKEALENLPKLFSPNIQVNEAIKPIVIIIDELDRCRPSYALQLLERMKHFFSVPRVHFVLGANLAQLANSVVATYGTGIDGQLYLQKFIHLCVQLPDLFEYDQTVGSKFLAHVLKQSELNGKNLEFVGSCIDDLTKITNHTNFSLRTLEQIYGHIIRVAATAPETQFRNSALVTGLSVLKVTAPELFISAKRGSLQFAEVLVPFGMLDSSDAKYNSEGSGYERRLSDQMWFEGMWRFASDKTCPESTIEQFKSLRWQYNLGDRMGLLKFVANEQVDRFISK